MSILSCSLPAGPFTLINVRMLTNCTSVRATG